VLPKFKTFNASNVELNRLQDNVGDGFNSVLTASILDYNIVTSQVLKVGDNVVNHRLGRAPLGWFIVRKRGAGNFYDKQDTNPTPAANIVINSDSAVTVDIYFF
jgi:hypothetical protein